MAKNTLTKITLTGIVAITPTLSSCDYIPNKINTCIARHQENDLYQDYKQTDPTNITQEQSQYLENLREKYGEFPVNVSKIEGIPKKWIDTISAITGKKKFNEKEFLFMSKTVRAATRSVIMNSLE